jgi:hypothetical protein
MQTHPLPVGDAFVCMMYIPRRAHVQKRGSARMNDGPLYRVTFRPVRDPAPRERPVSIRLRLFLKAALRAFGLRAVSVDEVQPGASRGASAEAGNGSTAREKTPEFGSAMEYFR